MQQSTIERRPASTAPAPRSTRAEEAWYERALRRYSVAALRVALGVVFVWFGALKVADVSPVGDLVASTLPFLDADLVVPGLGAFEVA
ncbi:MAG TPA: hypothetical protein VFR67_09855, partial [Pilimelia sp.]|nr:hypothetical protein [Pilimelia sp.]